jgi:alpha-L-rhamnosidase
MKKHSIPLFVNILIALSLVGLMAVGQSQPAEEQADRPNIIIILTDDQRWDALGYAGNADIKTPWMDRLASEGVFFRNAFVTTPICAASRASIWSGFYERTHRYTFQTAGLSDQYMKNAYPKLLRQSGYYTGFFGKFGVRYPAAVAMFDEFEDYDRNNRFEDRRGYFYKTLDGDTVHLTRYTGEKALDFIDNAPANQPFCLSISFSAPHAHDGAAEQYFWQKESDKLFRSKDLPSPALTDAKYFNALPAPVKSGFNRLRWTWRYDTPVKYQHSLKGYYRMIYGIDVEIGRIREKLRKKGLDKNTVIILLGDNGYFLGERQLAGKWLLYDNSVRVPFIMYDPRQPVHQDLDAMVLNLDVPATVVDLAGLSVPTDYHGESLLPIINSGKLNEGRDTILLEHLWEFDHIPPSEGVRTEQWKYFRYINDLSIEELYDLQNDPMEIVNLAYDAQYAGVISALRKKTDALGNRYSDPGNTAPEGLTVEYIRKPEYANILDPAPDFSWYVPHSAGFQRAYQVLVSTSRDLIVNNIGDMWNSGMVRSGQSVNVQYDGKPLEENAAYYWKVRLYDKHNRLSDYSEPQGFRTGGLKEDSVSANRFQIERIAPTQFMQTDKGNYFVDFGRDAFATLDLKYRSEGPETLKVRLGEKLKMGSIDREPGGSIRYQEVQLQVAPNRVAYTLQLPEDKRNTGSKAVQLPDSFDVLMPFRYVGIEGASSTILKQDIRQKAYFHYFEDDCSSFQSSDTVLNKIWDLCKYSMKATSFSGFYIDGDRERIPYEADAYINQLSHYVVDQEYAPAKRTIEYFMQNPTWPTEWQLHVALMFYQDYLYTGDTTLIARYYDKLKHKTLMKLTDERGLISTQSAKLNGSLMADLGFSDTTQRIRDIVDWPPAQKDTGWKLPTDWPQGERDGFQFRPFNTVINCFYHENMKIMAEFAQVLGRDEDLSEFEFRAAQSKKSINELMFDEQKGFYIDGIGAGNGSIHANMLPLAFGIVPVRYVESVVDHIKSRGMACSVYGAQYLLEGLFRAGSSAYALELMTATHDRSWYNMVKAGSSITMEAWDMRYKPNADWNHAWGASPGNIIVRHLWGIRPGAPGFQRVIVQPQLSELEQSEIVTPTIRGPICAQYKKYGMRQSQYQIELPGNMIGDLIISDDSNAIVTHNGRLVPPAFEAIRLEPGANKIEVVVNSF